MYGPNDAAVEKRQPLVLQFLARFRNPLIIILLAASAKASAGATIRAMAEAGIAAKVLTGDNAQVSRHVFEAIGVDVIGVLSGAELELMSDEALIGALPRVNRFCRGNPQQKHRFGFKTIESPNARHWKNA